MKYKDFIKLSPEEQKAYWDKTIAEAKEEAAKCANT